MNGSRHLLSLVSQMGRGHTIQSEQSRVTNEGDISAERRAEGLRDSRHASLTKTQKDVAESVKLFFFGWYLRMRSGLL